MPPIEVAIDIFGEPDYDRFLILEVGSWSSIKYSFQGMPAPDTAMNALKVACKANVRFAEQSNVAPIVCHT